MPELINDDVMLVLAGQPWGGWEEIMLERSIEQFSGAFSLALADKSPALPLSGAISPGKACQLRFGGEMVLDGWVDSVEAAYDKTTHSIAVAGRDKVGDLLDCAATIDGPFEYRNARLVDVLGALCRPYGITVTVSADTGKPFSRFSIQPGETAFAAIERACRYRAVLPVSDGIGGLAIVKPGANDSGASLVFGQNILSARASDDWRDRFSLYVVKGHSEATASSSSVDVAGAQGKAKDSDVRRFRPTVSVAEAQGDSLSLDDRAAWQAKFNRARSCTATYTVQGWRTAGGDLWQVNSLVKIVDPAGRRTGTGLIATARFMRSAAGTVTELTIVPPDAFTLPPEDEEAQA